MTYFGFVCLCTCIWQTSCRVFRSREEPAVVQLPLTRTEEGWYAVEVQVAGAATHLLVDTGSADLWARLPASTNGSKPVGAKPGGNKTKADLGKFSAQYGRGAVSGDVVEASVLLPGAAPQKPHSCRLGRPVDEVGFWARQRTIDGVMGLGCSRDGAPVDALACVVPAPPEQLLLFGPKKHRVFCLELTPTGGMLTLGSVPQMVKLNLVAMPVAQDCGHWTVPLVSLGVQGSGSADKLVTNAEAVLDSGSDGVIGPTFAVIELARRLGASPAQSGDGYGGEVTFYEVACDDVLNLPSVTLVLGDAHGATTSVTLQGSDLVSPQKEGAEKCHLRVAGWETQSWILGSVFLTRLQGVAFDVDTGVVSIAPPVPKAD